jgi:hypothetical protein
LKSQLKYLAFLISEYFHKDIYPRSSLLAI